MRVLGMVLHFVPLFCENKPAKPLFVTIESWRFGELITLLQIRFYSLYIFLWNMEHLKEKEKKARIHAGFGCSMPWNKMGVVGTTTKRYLQTVPFARALPLHRHQFHLAPLSPSLLLDATLGFALARPPSNCIDTSSCVKTQAIKKPAEAGWVLIRIVLSNHVLDWLLRNLKYNL